MSPTAAGQSIEVLAAKLTGPASRCASDLVDFGGRCRSVSGRSPETLT
jgi:hypothetical protein